MAGNSASKYSLADFQAKKSCWKKHSAALSKTKFSGNTGNSCIDRYGVLAWDYVLRSTLCDSAIQWVNSWERRVLSWTALRVLDGVDDW